METQPFQSGRALKGQSSQRIKAYICFPNYSGPASQEVLNSVFDSESETKEKKDGLKPERSCENSVSTHKVSVEKHTFSLFIVFISCHSPFTHKNSGILFHREKPSLLTTSESQISIEAFGSKS